MTAEATGPDGAVVTFTATATDTSTATSTPTCAPASGSTFALGPTTVTCTATDEPATPAPPPSRSPSSTRRPPRSPCPPTSRSKRQVRSGAVVTYSGQSATDLVDGSVPVTCSPASGSTFAIGTTTVTCSATDAHGNTGTKSFHVTVTSFFSGFYQPVDMGNVVNTVKGGSTVPLKFEVFGATGEIKTVNVVVTPLKAAKVSCANGSVEDTIELTATGGTSLRFDTTGDQFIYNWQTPKVPGACYNVTVSLTDGSSMTANFKLK